jgi:hypothetical protein
MEQDQQTPGTSLFQFNLEAEASYKLRSAASWAKVLSIVGFIIGALCIALAFIFQSAANKGGIRGLPGLTDRAAQAGITMVMVFCILFGAIFIISAIFAFNFSNKIATAIKTNDQQSLSSGLGAMRNYYAFRTIIMILWLLLFILWIIGIMNSTGQAGFNQTQ